MDVTQCQPATASSGVDSPPGSSGRVSGEDDGGTSTSIELLCAVVEDLRQAVCLEPSHDVARSLLQLGEGYLREEQHR